MSSKTNQVKGKPICIHCETLFHLGLIEKIRYANRCELETGMYLCENHYVELKAMRMEERVILG